MYAFRPLCVQQAKRLYQWDEILHTSYFFVFVVFAVRKMFKLRTVLGYKLEK